MKNGVDPQLGSKTEPDWGGLPQIVATFAAKAAGHDRTGAFAFDNYEQLHRLGFLALPIAREFGGLGGSLRDCLRFLGAVAEGDASTALVLSMYFNLHGAQARTRSWPTALYSRIARDSIEQLSLINALNYEPELGSPVRGTGVLGTVAREVSGGWRVSGRKRYATGSVGLRWFTITARTEQNVRGNWFIEADAPGLTIIENWDHLGLRSTASNDLILDDVFVPKDHIVGLMDKDPGERRGPGRSWSVVTWNAIYLGIAKAARNFLVDYVSRRAPGSLGHPLAELPHIRDSVGRIELLIRAAERLNLSIADDFESGSNPDLDASMTKHFVRAYAKEAVEIAVSAIGNAGLSKEFPLERHFRDVQFGPNHPPATDVIRKLAADAAFHQRRVAENQTLTVVRDNAKTNL